MDPVSKRIFGSINVGDKRLRESEGKSGPEQKRTHIEKLRASLQELNRGNADQAVEEICDAIDAELLASGYTHASTAASVASQGAGYAHQVIEGLEEGDLEIASVVGEGVASALGALGSVLSVEALKEAIAKVDTKLSKNPTSLEREKLMAERKELEHQLREAKADAAFGLAEAGADLVHNVSKQVAKYAPHVAEIAKPIAQVAETVSGGVAIATAAYELQKNVKILREANQEKLELEKKITELDDGALKETLKIRHAHLTGRKYTLALLKVIKSCTTLAGATGALVAGANNPISGAVLGAATAGGIALVVYTERANIEGTITKLPWQLRRYKIERQIAQEKKPIEFAYQLYNQRTSKSHHRDLQKLIKPSLQRLEKMKGAVDFYATKIVSDEQAMKVAAVTKAYAQARLEHDKLVTEVMRYEDFMLERVVVEVDKAKPKLLQLQKHLADVNKKIAMIDEKAKEGTIAIRAGLSRDGLARLRTWIDTQADNNFQEYFTSIGRGERFKESPTDTVVTYLFE